MRRGDVWRGHSQAFVAREAISSGFENCDSALLNNGWPTRSLIELCLRYKHSNSVFGGEWRLFVPVIKFICGQQADNFVVLLNPPATPFAPAFIQEGIPLNQLLVVEANKKQDFIASFTELSRSSHCGILLAWQPGQQLSYTELRKCQLACNEAQGLYILFRSHQATKQSSPAPLRLTITLEEEQLKIDIFKQRGLVNNREFFLNLPEHWQTKQAPKNIVHFPSANSRS